jgi:hypothetical protein
MIKKLVDLSSDLTFSAFILPNKETKTGETFFIQHKEKVKTFILCRRETKTSQSV